jgi:aminoglycoside phosphotransferase (APT) family kinase protein
MIHGMTDVVRLGNGESFTAWKVGDVVVRVPHRPVGELPRPPAAEFAALALVPPGLGPRPVGLEGATMVTTYVPGEVRADWDDDLLVAHARQLAVLHARRYDRCGEVTAPTSPVCSITDRYAAAYEWWDAHHPDVLEAADLEPAVRAYLDDTEPAFRRLDRFAHIHGDLVPSNILVDAGIPRYVDWEWSEIGDPAQDLAYLGGVGAPAPWYLPMDEARIGTFLDAYAEAAGVTDRAGLRVRRDAHEVFERFFTSLHFTTKGTGAPFTASLRALLR